jgi:hypothetical protein
MLHACSELSPKVNIMQEKSSEMGVVYGVNNMARVEDPGLDSGRPRS